MGEAGGVGLVSSLPRKEREDLGFGKEVVVVAALVRRVDAE